MAALAALQHALLGVGLADSQALARLVEDMPTAADPGLRAAVAAIALRARIDAARIEAARIRAADAGTGTRSATDT